MATFKHRSIVLGSLTIFSSLLMAQMPAMAVPGWAQTSRRLTVSPTFCKNNAQNAIRRATGQTGTFNQLSATTFLMTAYPRGTTGVFVYCVSHPQLVCNAPSSTLLIVAFSDNGSGEAVRWRDAIDRAVGNPVYFDCGTNLNPI